MKPRDLNGAINKAENVFVLVQYSKENTFYVRVNKPAAKELSADAKEKGANITATVEDGDVYIGLLMGEEEEDGEGDTDDGE